MNLCRHLRPERRERVVSKAPAGRSLTAEDFSRFRPISGAAADRRILIAVHSLPAERPDHWHRRARGRDEW